MRDLMERLYRAAAWNFGPKRMRQFADLFQPRENTTVLDIGGSPFRWQMANIECRLFVCNLDRGCKGHRFLVADGRRLPFADQSFDIVFSNSVIEHVGDWESQTQFASEIRRVGKSYYVQTPNRMFPIEPHYMTPFVQFTPQSVRPRILRYSTVWGWLSRPSPERCREVAAEIQLLDEAELRRLFPGAAIVREKLLGLTKSLIAVRLPTHGRENN
jgi:SAM-dependent methyltransferase